MTDAIKTNTTDDASAQNSQSADYVKRLLAWVEFQQHHGHSLGSMMSVGLRRIAGSGLKPSPVVINKKRNKRNQNEAVAVDPAELKAQQYQQWMYEVEHSQKTAILPTTGPLISIIVPIYRPPVDILVDTIESVLNQSYQDWQLILVDDHSDIGEITEVTRLFEAADPRIKSITLEKNGHISRASQIGLESGEGEFIALLDHDDLLPVRALARIAKEIAEHPKARYFYSDEDKISQHGERYDPHFKSAWNPQLLLAQNYICHLSVIERQLALEAGGFREGFEGSQDHDLTLRCTGRLKAEQIRHVPEVLYHWRAIEGSTALDSDAKHYSNNAGLKAVQNYLDEHTPGAKVVPAKVPNAYRVRYPIPFDEPKVSLIIPARDQRKVTEQAITSILHKTTYTNFEILVIDNGSTEHDALAYFESLRKMPNVRVLEYPHGFNYSAINNFAVQNTDAEIIGLVNNDVEVISENWLTEMVSLALMKDTGCVGAKLYYAEEKIQHAGVILGIGGVAGHSHKYYPRNSYGYFSRLLLTQNLSAVTGACLIVRRDVFLQVNGLEEQALTVAFNDVDFCLKVLSAGYKNIWTPYAELYHHESLSRGEEDSPEKIIRFNREADWMRNKWGALLKNDPHYNPHLSLTHEDFSLRVNA